MISVRVAGRKDVFDVCILYVCFVLESRSGELRTRKLKSHLVRTQSLNVLPLKPGLGQYTVYMLRLLPGISSLFLPFQSIHLHFFQNLSRFFSCVDCC